MNFKSLFFLFLVFLFCLKIKAGLVDTVNVWSPSMHRNIKTIVIMPEEKLDRYPTVYLLHGYGGDHLSWLTVTKPELPELADLHKVIFVCTDGGNSWYFDSIKDSSICYTTFITKELIHYVDDHYPTIASRAGRAITGFSMGGHGALWCALNSNMFCAAGSMSGGVNLVPYSDSWEIKKVLGPYHKNYELWEKSSIINNVGRLKGVNLIIDCGIDDFFYTDNIKLHNKLVSNKIPHDFISRPGNHTHTYWSNSLDYQLIYFCKSFHKELFGK